MWEYNIISTKVRYIKVTNLVKNIYTNENGWGGTKKYGKIWTRIYIGEKWINRKKEQDKSVLN